MKLIGPKRLCCLRWAISLLALVALIAIPISIWTPQRLGMKHVGKSKVEHSLSLSLQQAQFGVTYFDVYRMHAKPSWDVHMVQRKYLRPNTALHWWDPPIVSVSKSPSASLQTVRRLIIRVPLVYLAPVLVGVSWFLWRRVQKPRGTGVCLSCGYQLVGLESPTCPECGVVHE